MPIDHLNPPAFPIPAHTDMFGEECNESYGLSVRDLFAAVALQGILAGEHPITRDPDCAKTTASAAYEFADAMMEVRNHE